MSTYGYGELGYGEGGWGGYTMTVTKELTLEFSEEGELLVTTTIASGGVTNPYQGVDVTVADPDGDFSETKTTDGAGEAVFSGLATDRSYEVTGSPPDSDIGEISEVVDFTV